MTTSIYRKNLTESISELVHYTNQKLYQENGPSVFRMFELHIKGYKRFKDAATPRLKERAELHRRWCLRAYPILLTVKTYTPGNKVGAKVENASRDFRAEFGNPSLFLKLQSVIFLVLATCLKIRAFLPRRIPQPRLGKYFYHNGA